VLRGAVGGLNRLEGWAGGSASEPVGLGGGGFLHVMVGNARFC
jgi:hypothetical protein